VRYQQTEMKLRQTLILTFLFTATSIAFALNWDRLYRTGPDEQKGDYIIYCLQVSLTIELIFMTLIRLLNGNAFAPYLIIVVPIAVAVISIILSFMASSSIGDTKDQSVLRVFLIIQSVLSTTFALAYAYSRKRTKEIS
jgi:hypothetical protein